MSPNPRYRIVVPARRGSTRLPDKMLADVGGMPLLARVLQNAARAAGAAQVVAAVEDETLARAARAAGFLAVATGAAESGSARAAAACEKLGIADDEIIVNVQGDEPFIEPQIVAAVAARLADAADCACATAARPLAGIEEWRDPNVVKVIADCDGRAMTFSRAPIPHPRAAAGRGRASRLRAGAFGDLRVSRRIFAPFRGVAAVAAGDLRIAGAIADFVARRKNRLGVCRIARFRNRHGGGFGSRARALGGGRRLMRLTRLIN